MNKKKFSQLLAASAAIVCLATPLNASKLFNKEAVIGAASGGIAGGIIGNQTGSSTEGAILGSVAGFALGTTINNQKERHRKLARNQAALREQVSRQQDTISAAREAPPPVPVPASRPELTDTEKQQMLLQHRPLFTVRQSK